MTHPLLWLFNDWLDGPHCATPRDAQTQQQQQPLWPPHQSPRHLIAFRSPPSIHIHLHAIAPCIPVQGVYKFNWTNFQEISRRLQEGFQEKSRTCLHCFGLLCNVPNLLLRCSLPEYRTKTLYTFYTTWGRSKDKIGRPVSTQISDLVDWYPVLWPETNAADHLTQNFQEVQ